MGRSAYPRTRQPLFALERSLDRGRVERGVSVNNRTDMDQNEETPKPPAIDWRESWGPAFQRVLLSIAAVDRFERGTQPED